MRLLCAAILCFALPAHADDWRGSWDGALYGYAGGTSLNGDSILNPGNRIARLPQHSDIAEARFNFKSESDALRFTLRPILLAQNDRNTFGSQRRNEAYLSQWQLRVRATETWSASAGREVLNWGAAQFRSPSSPSYFDNGRSNPMRELSGVDAVKLSWAPDVRSAVYLARLTGSGHVAGNADPWRGTWLLKAEQRGADWAGGAVVARKPGRAVFLGAHLQKTVGDEWLLYGEAGSYTHANALLSPADTAQPFSIAPESARRTDVLLGAAYTLENGQSFAVEYLNYGHGYGADAASAYFTRAAASSPAAGLALGYAPPLLNRDYLHLVWQSNLMAEGGYWRLMFTDNLNDHSTELSGYGEYTLGSRITGYALAVLPAGGAKNEFSALLVRGITLGIKVALP